MLYRSDEKIGTVRRRRKRRDIVSDTTHIFLRIVKDARVQVNRKMRKLDSTSRFFFKSLSYFDPTRFVSLYA